MSKQTKKDTQKWHRLQNSHFIKRVPIVLHNFNPFHGFILEVANSGYVMYKDDTHTHSLTQLCD